MDTIEPRRGISEGDIVVEVAMCGEMAGDPRCVPLLIGMGLREFSMQPAALLTVREQLGQLDAASLGRAAERLFADPSVVNPLERFEALMTAH